LFKEAFDQLTVITTPNINLVGYMLRRILHKQITSIVNLEVKIAQLCHLFLKYLFFLCEIRVPKLEWSFAVLACWSLCWEADTLLFFFA
jgi:hypothetical protein